MSKNRVVAFAGVCVFAVTIIVVALVHGARSADEARKPTAGTSLDSALNAAAVRAVPHIVFRSTTHGPTYGRLGLVPLDNPDGPRALLPMHCARVYATRTVGMCLTDETTTLSTHRALILDGNLSPGRSLPLSGIPSRTRLSPDGAFAATTVFVEGHSYAQGGFSTATTIYDMRGGRSLGNVEEFRVIRDGKRYRSTDLNVWGVTFVDSNRFYATVATHGQPWLAEGDLSRRELRMLRVGVECPSVSPDGTRVAYKKRNPGEGFTWRLHVLDLRTGHDVALGETRTVDDQAEWLDDQQVLYSLPRDLGDETDIWVAAADGSGHPRVLVPRAWSPAVVR